MGMTSEPVYDENYDNVASFEVDTETDTLEDLLDELPRTDNDDSTTIPTVTKQMKTSFITQNDLKMLNTSLLERMDSEFEELNKNLVSLVKTSKTSINSVLEIQVKKSYDEIDQKTSKSI